MKNFKLIVKDQNNKILHEPEFDTALELEQHKGLILDKNEWNFPTKEVLVPAWQETIPAKDAVLDKDGNIIVPAEPEHIVFHPDELKQVPDVIFDIVDNTAANEAEKVKENKKKADHGDAITALKAIDLNNISNADLKIIAKHLVINFLKDEA